MSLSVLVKSASDLPNVERFSKSDPMCVITLKGKIKKTEVINSNLDPKWNQNLKWTLVAALSTSEVLKVEVYDHEKVGRNRLLGTLDLNLRDVILKGEQSVNTALKSKDGVATLRSKINLDLTYTPPAGDGRGAGRRGQEEQGIVEAGEEGDVMGGKEGGEGHEDKGGEWEEGGWGGDPGRHRHSQQKISASRFKLPKKPLDFQVRMHFLEARKLIGGALNPVVKVVCGEEIKETSTQKGTNSPYWNEMLYFNFKERPDEMFDKVVEIKVLDAKQFISDALIGSFKFDLGMMYNEAGHGCIHKWLLLTDPNDATAAAKGYLKFSIQILGPGDHPKPSPSEMSSDDVDIEANLLRPSGIHLRAATIHVRIFRGQDFPQMDAGYFEKLKKFLHVGSVQKELVDPYCTVAFAGHEGKTEVIWNQRDPEWNHQINLGIRFPSMCERLRFQVMDKDPLNADDFIGTCYLNMSQISPPGDTECLPTFGPCFVNIYGSPREFSNLPDKYDRLNKGLIEGVSYRGRVMVEVDTSLGTLPTNKYEEIKLADQKKIIPYLSHQKYRLYGAFFSATMVCPIDAAVQFEISIGNYGNKLDTTTPAQSSTTPPTNPVYDGNKYYFLPWLDQKPCTMVDSWWQDCTYRIESLNILISTADTLEKELKAVKMTDDEDTVKEKLGEVLNNFLTSLDQRLPKLPDKAYTRLDKRTREYRKQEWKSLREDAKHLQRKMTEYKPKAIFDLCEEYVQRLRSHAIEPQICIPDVIIWMLSGSKRVACKRIPSHLLMYSTIAKARGALCGKVQTIFLTPPAVQKEEEMEGLKDGAQVRLMLWLGQPKHSDKWSDGGPGGDVTIFAEAYENEAFMLGKWGEMGLTRPHLSDSHGKIKIEHQKLEEIEAPPGWKWEGSWEKKPDASVAHEPDESLDEWTEDVFENQVRQLPLLRWPDKSYWSDTRGGKLMEFDGKEEKELLSRDDINAPDGWLWKTEWTFDTNRAVDENGWEYCIEAGLWPWVPYERNFHLYRRRRWVRLRVRDKDFKDTEKKSKRMKAVNDGWEYAHLANLTYHITEHPLDFARRRRWLRKLVATRTSETLKPDLFQFKGKKEKKDEDHEDVVQQVPRIYLTFKDTHTYQLRAYLYQARNMYGSDRSGISDPYAELAFSCKSVRSRHGVKRSGCPTWDETLIVKQLRFFGDRNNIQTSPPPVVIEFFNKGTIGQDEYIGKVVMIPTVRFSLDTPEPRLVWHDIERYTKYAGELLAASELLLDEGGELPFTPPTSSPPDTYYIVPSGIRPILQRTRIEVLCWGVRGMKCHQLLKVTHPLVELECGDTVVSSKPIEDASKNPNFSQPIVTMDVNLPKEELYAPPLKIRIRDKRRFNTPVVGTHIIKSVKDKKFQVDPEFLKGDAQAVVKPTTPTPTDIPPSSIKEGEVAVVMEGFEAAIDPDDLDSRKKTDFDWWTKYYNAITGQHGPKVYRSELEESFNHFADVAQNFSLHRGKGSWDPDDSKGGEAVGYFKGSVKMYPLPEVGSPEPGQVFVQIPSPHPISVIVRVYIIRGIELQPRDPDGKSDPYLKVKIGGKELNSKEKYIRNELNPIFGQMFELPARLPLEHTLTITVMDWDRFSADDLIGATSIDIENRFLSQHRATCGLPESYFVRGPNTWRDQEPPVDILDKWCKLKSIADPKWSADYKKVDINGKSYDLHQFEKGKQPHPDMGKPQQRLALHVLRQQGLVPEHIETRNLYTPMQPNISQGQLHMWVDIFRKNGDIPPPVDISPHKPEKYVLRIVVWNTKDVILEEDSIVTGEAMSDIFVKGWLQGEDETQKTDVHYRSFDGEGNFNWRFVFPFMYISTEKVMIIKKKEHFYSLTMSEKRLPPRLTLQVWDSDHFTPNDFLGTLVLNLCAMPKPASDSFFCSLDQLLDEVGEEKKARKGKLVDLFKKKRMKGWWPVYSLKSGDRKLTGKLELEMEVVSEEEEQLRPAGKARDEPNMNPVLYPPNRPATSFLWFSSPWRTFKFIVWRYYKWYIIGGIILILLVGIIVIFIYTLPNALTSAIVNRIIPG